MSQMTVIHGVPAVRLQPAGQRPNADRGDPQLRTLPIDSHVGGNAGVWECEPGGWPVVNRPDTEVAYIVAGRATITDDSTGEAQDITAGSLVVLPEGWSGRWEVTETIRKVYAIF